MAWKLILAVSVLVLIVVMGVGIAAALDASPQEDREPAPAVGKEQSAGQAAGAAAGDEASKMVLPAGVTITVLDPDDLPLLESAPSREWFHWPNEQVTIKVLGHDSVRVTELRYDVAAGEYTADGKLEVPQVPDH